MLPLLAVSAVGSGLSGIISSKHNLAFYTMTGGQALQVIGMGLMSSTSTDLDVHPSQYGVQAILGLGFGLGLSSLILLARAEADSDDSGELRNFEFLINNSARFAFTLPSPPPPKEASH